MHKITPLNASILAKAKQGQSSLQFIIKTRVCVAISTGRKNRVRQNHITTKTEGLTHQTAASCLKFEPPSGAIVNHPKIKVPQQSASHIWVSAQAKPTAGSR